MLALIVASGEKSRLTVIPEVFRVPKESFDATIHSPSNGARIAEDVRSGLSFLAKCDGEAAGTVRFQLEEELFWPDVPQDDSAFIHRLAVKRRFAGGEISSALILWAIARTHALGRRYLRLDCIASRPRLRALYERMGFRFHSNRQVGLYYVSRYEFDVMEIQGRAS